MKTVMKKMFCLLLVAVMLVGALPFAAFAEGEAPCTTCGATGHDSSATHCGECFYYEGHDPAKCTSGCNGTSECTWPYVHKTGCISKAVCSHCPEVGKHLSENCPYYCANCPAEGHDESDPHCTVCHYFVDHNPTCTAGCKESLNCDWAYTHKSNCGKTCTNNDSCPNSPSAQHVANCPKACTGEANCPNTAHHASTCKKLPCSVAGCQNGNGHTGTCSVSCTLTTGCAYKNRHEGACFVPCADSKCVLENDHTGDCAYCAVCLADGDKVKKHQTAAHCDECDNTDGTHKQTCSYYVSSGNATVHVHVRLHTSNVLTKTVELLTYKDSSDARVYSSVAKHDDLIRAELKKQYPGYSWSGNLYDDPKELEDTKETIGKGTTVYINAYTDQDLIYIYVHNSRSMSNLRIIQLEGKKVGETVTKTEVTNAVKKYFSVNSLSMYSEQAWEDYVDGDSVESVSSLKVTSDPYFIDVKISGSAKSSSGSGSTADSTNPKTGDEIFAPAMVLGLSASALVVLYFLNKKRAY